MIDKLKETYKELTKNEKIILSVLLVVLIAMIWLGVSVADLKDSVSWLMGY